MIGVFAKMFGPNDRVSEVTPLENGYEVKAKGSGLEESVVADDEPPAAFVEKVPSEGGTVYMSPFVEALKNLVRRGKGEE